MYRCIVADNRPASSANLSRFLPATEDVMGPRAGREFAAVDATAHRRCHIIPLRPSKQGASEIEK